MKPERTVQFLKLLKTHVPIHQPRGGWIVASCPLAPWRHDGGTDKHPAFAVKRQAGDAFTNCFACGWHGSMSDLVIEMQHLNKLDKAVDVKWSDALAMIDEAEAEDVVDLDFPDIEEMLFGEKPQLHQFPEWWLDSFPEWHTVGWAKDYLAKRDVPAWVATRMDVRADTKQKRVCFPVRDFDGRLMGLHGRAVEDGVDPRYRMYLQGGRNNPILWLGESWIDRARPVVVVEGPFDTASVMRVYDNVASPLFVNPSHAKIMRMADALEQVTFFDRGKGGDLGREKYGQAIGKTHLLHHVVPPQGRKDPGACTPEEIAQILADCLALS